MGEHRISQGVWELPIITALANDVTLRHIRHINPEERELGQTNYYGGRVRFGTDT